MPTEEALPTEFSFCRRLSLWLLPLIAILLLTVLIRLSDADLSISQRYFAGRYRHWDGLDVSFFQLIYAYGQIPAFVLALLALLASFFRRLNPYRLQCFFVAASIAFGPGAIINGVLKPNVCRPRPTMTVEFGGRHAFLPIGQIGVTDIDDSSPSGMSFPSGHAAMGFALMVPAFVLFRRRRAWAWWFIILGLVSGTFLGFVRISQGAHFLSDVVWSLGTVYFSALFVGLSLDLAIRRWQAWRTTAGMASRLPIRQRVPVSNQRPTPSNHRARKVA